MGRQSHGCDRARFCSLDLEGELGTKTLAVTIWCSSPSISGFDHDRPEKSIPLIVDARAIPRQGQANPP
jgi:hypothetical protein